MQLLKHNSYSRLEILSTIEEIRGPLRIERFPSPTFPYLRNLKRIGSPDTEMSVTACGSESKYIIQSIAYILYMS